MFLRTGFFIFSLCLAFQAYAADTVPTSPPVVSPPAVSAHASASPADQAPAQPLAPVPSAPSASDAATPSADVAPPPLTASVDSIPAPEPAKPADYIIGSWADLLHTMVRFNAIDLEDNNLVDEYAAVTDCDIYKLFNKDDFKWNAIRKRVRESADLNMNSYPAHYYFYTILFLDHYDFERKLYRFTPETTIHNMNVFTLFQTQAAMCNGQKAEYIPKSFQAVSDVPFNMIGLPLSPDDAQSLLRQMNVDKNIEHAVIIKFNMTVTYIDRMRKALDRAKNATYFQSIDKPPPAGTLRIYTHIDSVEFYEDIGMTKLVYSTKP